jgi:hypothetical protein
MKSASRLNSSGVSRKLDLFLFCIRLDGGLKEALERFREAALEIPSCLVSTSLSCMLGRYWFCLEKVTEGGGSNCIAMSSASTRSDGTKIKLKGV